MQHSARSGGDRDRGTIISIATVCAVLSLLTVAIVASAPLKVIAPALLLVLLLTLSWRALTPWPRLLGAMILVIMFIPIRRYELPFSVGVQMEPYRLLVGLIVLGWIVSLLVDRRVRVRPTGFEGPLLLLFVTAVASEGVNMSRFHVVQANAIKALSFLLSFMLVFYVVVSVIRSEHTVERLSRVLVGSGAVVGLCTLYEARTGTNVFDGLHSVLPFLRLQTLPYVGNDGRGYRAYASAQHPIALGAALVLLLPLAFYLIQKTRQKRWWLATALILLGALVTRSRTGVLMLVVIAIVYAVLRRRQVQRFWPAIFPLFVALHIAAPGTIGTIKGSFFPKGGISALTAEQNGNVGSGRIASLGPGLKEWRQRPFLGEGYGSRIVDGPQANAFILDDQWLTTLLEVGIFGALGWGWLFWRAIRRFGRAAKEDHSERGWLYVGLAAGVTGYAISMATYDAFAFIQVSFLLFLMLGFGVCVLRESGAEPATAAAPRGAGAAARAGPASA
jgi:O-antigen ligase